MQKGSNDCGCDKMCLNMDKIIIKGACFSCSIGVSEEERRKKQKIGIDVELFLSTRKAAKTDSIKNTINYSEVYNLLKNIVEKNNCRLIEKMAENISEQILSKYSVEKVIVKIKKPEALAGRSVKYAAVEIERKNG